MKPCRSLHIFITYLYDVYVSICCRAFGGTMSLTGFLKQLFEGKLRGKSFSQRGWNQIIRPNLCVLQKALLNALLQLSGGLRITAHGDDDLYCVAVVHVCWQAGAGGIHQNYLNLIWAVCFLHKLSLGQKAWGRTYCSSWHNQSLLLMLTER